MSDFTVFKPKYTHAEYKELAMITAYIIDYDLLDLGDFFNKFEAGWLCAEAFLKEYPEGTDWEAKDIISKDWDEAIESFCEDYKNN